MKETSFQEFLEGIRNRRIPFNTVFELTSRCNLSCVHCYQSRGTRDGLTGAAVRSILEQLKEAGCLKLIFTGGEPTLRKDFRDIYREAHEMGFAVTLYTNGTLLGRETRSLLAARPPLAVEVSLYGAAPETHDRVTGKHGSFDAAVHNLRRMSEDGLPVVVKTVVMTLNYREQGRLRSLAEDLGAPLRSTFRIFAPADRDRSVVSLRLPEGDIRDLASKTSPDPLRAEENETEPQESFLCHAGSDSCCVGSDGDVFPCTVLRWRCGNLKTQSFHEIWNASPVLARWRAVTERDYPSCLACAFRDRCRFCPGMGFMEHGNALVPSQELCRITKAMWSER